MYTQKIFITIEKAHILGSLFFVCNYIFILSVQPKFFYSVLGFQEIWENSRLFFYVSVTLSNILFNKIFWERVLNSLPIFISGKFG